MNESNSSKSRFILYFCLLDKFLMTISKEVVTDTFLVETAQILALNSYRDWLLAKHTNQIKRSSIFPWLKSSSEEGRLWC
jgi:hypothetical protein